MSDAAKQGPNWGTLVLILVLVPAVYVLSLGPAAVLGRRVEATAPVLNVVYAPLEWLVRNSDLSDRVLWKYIEFWLNITETPI